MKMKKMRPVFTMVEKLCEVKYYVWVEPLTDPHFRPDPSYVWQNKYFDTEEEAVACMNELKKMPSWNVYSVREEITELE